MQNNRDNSIIKFKYYNKVINIIFIISSNNLIS